MTKSLEERNHQEWLGYVQPIGLVVSTPAMLAAQCHINKNIVPEQRRFLSLLPDEDEERVPAIATFHRFATQVLGWRDSDIRGMRLDGLPDEFKGLEVVLPEYGETLRPTFAVPSLQTSNEEPETRYQLLVKESDFGVSMDKVVESDSRRWQASPHAKFERLLRETEIPVGLLYNGTSVRIVYAPRGETSGYLTFEFDQMATVAGRPIFAAMHMLLSEERLFALEPSRCLPAILANSRKYQSAVSTKLAQQVMSALFELLRGFQSANDQRDGDLLRRILEHDAQHVYHGLLTVLMRTVFILFAEDRGLISTDSVYTNHYSITGLFDRLRSDAGRYPDTMDQRYGAWAQLLTLFRLISNGGQHADLKIPPRDGYLFDPNRYPFLEGRFDDNDVNIYSDPERRSAINVPRVSDGVIYRVLHNLLVLDGERLSYRTLDVEQIGSVYEAIMGFELEVATGRSIAVKPIKSHGAPATISLEGLLETKPADRAKRLKELTDQKLGTADAKAMKESKTVDDLLAALGKKVASNVTPNIVPKGAMIFQPSDERRRSGSHYTPRSLTEPIVRTTLEPILKQLWDSESELPTVFEPTREDKRRYTKGEIEARIRLSQRKIKLARQAREVGSPHPEQILDLAVCDPAMGSGAFLVETCRQLGDELIKSWAKHQMPPTDIPPDEDEVLYARRLIAQRCLYGVDKNVMAVDLAKLSLWLVTLAKDHAFTFLDHSLRYGDSLVGLTRRQIIAFHWEPKKQQTFGEELIQKRLDKATEARAKILNAREDVAYRDQQQKMALAEEALSGIRLLGNACVSAFFAGTKKREREDRVEELFGIASAYLEKLKAGEIAFELRKSLQAAADSLLAGEHPIPAFHWEIEFPEVFSRENGGFDAFVGNPPFAGKNTLINSTPKSFPDWLKAIHQEAHGNSDVVAHFFRRTFSFLRRNGCFGLIATKTIRQGDTRLTGLRWICTHDGEIYHATRRLRWPGQAAVMVSVVHVSRGVVSPERLLDNRVVPRITAFLFHAGGNDDPVKLIANDGKSFIGHFISGTGFTFDDSDNTGFATSIAKMHELVQLDERNQERIFPYIGGEEVLNDPTHQPRRFVINFEEMTEDVARSWPDLLAIVETNVRPEREGLPPKNSWNRTIAEKWWLFGAYRKELRAATSQSSRILFHPNLSSNSAFAFLPANIVVGAPHNVFAFEIEAAFAVLQSRTHENWAWFFGSTFKDDLRYTPSRCFETFPLPNDLESSASLENVGKHYYEFRANFLVENDIGLTKTYNRFHDPHEQAEGIFELRRLHGLMDEAVLRAYGWDDLADSATCGFLLDYEEEEDEGELPTARRSKRKKPWRYRWPDEFRDEVLARLLELNEQRHKEELLAGEAAAAAEKKAKAATKAAAKQPPATKTVDSDLFPSLEHEEALVVMSVAAWEKPISRNALENMLILMLNNQHRVCMAGSGPPQKSKIKVVVGLNDLLAYCEAQNWIETIPGLAQHSFQVGKADSPLGPLKARDKKAIEAVKLIFEQAKLEGKVIETKEVLDATENFVLTG